MTMAGQRFTYRQPAVIFGILAVVLAVGLVTLVSRQTDALIAHAHEDLATILVLKVQAIEKWLDGNRRDALLIANSDTFQDDAALVMDGDARGERQALEQRLETMRQSLQAGALILLDKAGHRVAAAGDGDPAVSADLVEQAVEVVRSGAPLWNYIHLGADTPPSPVYIDYLVPLRIPSRKGAFDGVLVLRRKGLNFFFPLIQSWPIRSRSAETLLVRRRGDQVEFLNELRFRKGTALSLRLPIGGPRLPAVQGLLAGKPIIVDGKDYRGVDVLAAARPIAGTDWVMISKIDRDEALAPIRRITWTWVEVILAFLILASLGTGALWRQTKRIAGAREQALESARQRFNVLSRHANDVILLLDGHDRIVEANERAFKRYGTPRERLIGSPVSALVAPAARERLDKHFDRVMRDGSERYETVHVTAAGVEIPVEVSGHQVLAGDQRYVLNVVRDISERKRAEAALLANNQQLQTIIQHLPFGMIIAQDDGLKGIFANDAFTAITGYGLEEAGTFENAMQLFVQHADQRAAIGVSTNEMVAEARRTGRPSQMRLDHIVRRDGSPRDVEVQFVDLGEFGVWTFHDVTARVEAEQRVARLSMLKAALSAINQVIVRVDSMQVLWDAVCDVTVERAGSLGAWVGVIDSNSKPIRLVASAGIIVDQVREVLAGTSDDAASIDGLIRTAVDDAHIVICKDFLNDPRTARWHELGRQYGVTTSAVIPLIGDGKTVAVLVLYFDGKTRVDDEMVALFEEMADDLSYAQEAIRVEYQRRSMEKQLSESEVRFRAIIEQSISGIYIIDRNARFIYVNPRMAEIFGYASNDELVGVSIADLVAPESRTLVARNLRKRLDRQIKTMRYDFAGLRKDGSTITVGAHGTTGVYRGQPVVIGTLQDVTEVRRSEERVKQYVETLERTMRSTIEIISNMVEMRDPYTQGHERRVGEIAAAIGGELGLDEQSTEGLRIAGHVHDVGKISIPAEILSKPGRLSKIEYELVKNHAQQGYDILKAYEFPWPIAQTVLQHHERLDGSGYPQGLKGDEILLEARILMVADVVEAMSSHRPYREGLGLESALAEIEKGAGKLYDPEVVGACLRLFREKSYQIPN